MADTVVAVAMPSRGAKAALVCTVAVLVAVVAVAAMVAETTPRLSRGRVTAARVRAVPPVATVLWHPEATHISGPDIAIVPPASAVIATVPGPAVVMMLNMPGTTLLMMMTFGIGTNV